MSRATAEDFQHLVSGIDDDAIRNLFGQRFLMASEIYRELVDAATVAILERNGFLSGIGPDEEKLPPRCRPTLRFLRSRLAHMGEPPARSVEDLSRELTESVPEAAVGAEIVNLLVTEAPGFFSGQKSGEEILFAPTRLPLWFRYFANDSILYAINNTLGAEILSRLAPEGARVLEIGGGCGSAAEAALKRIGARLAHYRFTEIVPTFLRRGERAARAASQGTEVVASRLDMTKPWADQGIEPGTFDVVYSVNCFHVAPDLDQVLLEAKGALRPGGVCLVSECVRPDRVGDRPVYVEFVFGFLESFTNVKTHAVRRPTHGFLTPSAWRASFEAAGFEDVTIRPDVDALAARYDDFVIGTISARRGAT